jgi:geranylgeranyl reductase family protein
MSEVLVVEEHFDVVVVGSGPAGSVTALVLARGGARVALVDKAGFPRDKACGDAIGPRAVAVLDDLGLTPTDPRAPLGDMVVVGPSGRRLRLPCFDGIDYPGYGYAIPRLGFDAWLVDEALGAGATSVTGRVQEIGVGAGDGPREGLRDGGGADPHVIELDGGRRLRADVVVGADGATSRVADAAGLVDARRVLWGFAVRAYLDEPVALPHIVLWQREPGRVFPGYGWLFPGPDGRANAGLGIGTLSDRRAGAGAVRLLPDFLEHLRRMGLVDKPGDGSGPGRLGGWLKMGMVGTTPAAGRVLLTGDAAGLVNPLQGEGIAHAMTSGRLAAEAVLAGPGTAAARYRAGIARQHLAYHRVAAAAHATLVGRPATAAVVGKLLTHPLLGRPLAGGWSVFWNELLDGTPPGIPRTVAAAASVIGRAVTRRSASARWFDTVWPTT